MSEQTMAVPCSIWYFWDAQEVRRLEKVWRNNMRCAAMYWRKCRRARWTRKAAQHLESAKVWRDGALNWHRQAIELDLRLNSQPEPKRAPELERDWEDVSKQYQPV